MLLALVAVGIVYVGGGYLAYQELSVVNPHCGGRPMASNTPANFTTAEEIVARIPGADGFRFTDFIEIAFPTRRDGLTIRG
ncbi:MAG TPA: hypothetical protein VK194_07515 [Candidatus Deferrimicrobium sp.]|nr:hypothetical protein [Candidatus Deferrimicrobium sp.]